MHICIKIPIGSSQGPVALAGAREGGCHGFHYQCRILPEVGGLRQKGDRYSSPNLPLSTYQKNDVLGTQHRVKVLEALASTGHQPSVMGLRRWVGAVMGNSRLSGFRNNDFFANVYRNIPIFQKPERLKSVYQLNIKQIQGNG
jgi:hypothetical protein